MFTCIFTCKLVHEGEEICQYILKEFSRPCVQESRGYEYCMILDASLMAAKMLVHQHRPSSDKGNVSMKNDPHG